MNIEKTPQHRSFRVSFWLLSLGIIGIGIYSLITLRQTSAQYDGVLAMQSQMNGGSVELVELPGVEKKLNIPN